MISMSTLSAGQAENYYDKDDLYYANEGGIGEGRIQNSMSFDPQQGLVEEWITKEKYQETIKENELFKGIDVRLKISEELLEKLSSQAEKKETFNNAVKDKLSFQAEKSGFKFKEKEFVYNKDGLVVGARSHNIATEKYSGIQRTFRLDKAISNINQCLNKHNNFKDINNLVNKDSIKGYQEVRRGRIGLDMTFSVPKSVSLMRFSEQHKSLIEQSHITAASNVLKHVNSDYAVARIQDNGKAGMIKGDLNMQVFNHELSRNKDPQYHSHVVVFNRMKCEDGVTRSVEFGDLLNQRKQLGYIYRTELARELQMKGIELKITDPKEFFFEIKEVPDTLIQEMSSRRQEIEKEWEIRGIDPGDKKSKDQAVLFTRDRKSNVNLNEEKLRWEGDVRGLQLRVQGPIDTPVMTADKAIREIELKQLTFTERSFLLDYKKVNPYAEIHDIKAEFKKRVASGQILSLDIKGKTVYATRKGLNAEIAIKKTVENGRGVAWSIQTSELSDTSKQSLSNLNQGQHDSVLNTLSSSDRFYAIEGDAGSGKTFMLANVKELCDEKGIEVSGMSFTGKATDGMAQESQIDSKTVHSFLNKLEFESLKNQGLLDVTKVPSIEEQSISALKNLSDQAEIKQEWDLSGLQPKPGEKPLWVVDEASMMDSNLTRTLFDAAEKMDAKVVLIGDRKQLEAIGAGTPFASLLNEKLIGCTRMNEVFRQKIIWHVYGKETLSPVEIDVLRQSAKDNKAVLEIHEKGSLDPRKVEGFSIKSTYEGPSGSYTIYADTSLKRAVDEMAAGSAVQNSVDLLKDNISRIDNKAERFSKISTDFVEKYNAKDFDSIILISTNADRKALNYSIRDGLKEEGVLKEGINIEIPKTFGDPEKMEISINDRIMSLKNDEKLGLRNGSMFTVKGIEDGKLLLESEGTKERKVIDTAQYKKFTHAYAVTIHKAQGMSVKDVYCNIDIKQKSFAYRNNLYVAFSRAKESLKIYTNGDKEKIGKLFDRVKSTITVNDFLKKYDHVNGSFVLRQGVATELKYKDQIARLSKSIGKPFSDVFKKGYSVATKLRESANKLFTSFRESISGKEKTAYDRGVKSLTGRDIAPSAKVSLPIGKTPPKPVITGNEVLNLIKSHAPRPLAYEDTYLVRVRKESLALHQGIPARCINQVDLDKIRATTCAKYGVDIKRGNLSDLSPDVRKEITKDPLLDKLVLSRAEKNFSNNRPLDEVSLRVVEADHEKISTTNNMDISKVMSSPGEMKPDITASESKFKM